jgi:hypothetical protein
MSIPIHIPPMRHYRVLPRGWRKTGGPKSLCGSSNRPNMPQFLGVLTDGQEIRIEPHTLFDRSDQNPALIEHFNGIIDVTPADQCKRYDDGGAG